MMKKLFMLFIVSSLTINYLNATKNKKRKNINTTTTEESTNKSTRIIYNSDENSTIENNSIIEELDLSNQEITSMTMWNKLQEFNFFNNVKKLNLSNNSDNAIDSLACLLYLRNNDTLEELNISNTKIIHTSVLPLLRAFPNLKKVDISTNPQALEHLDPDWFDGIQYDCMKELNASHTEITHIALLRILNMFPKLEILDLSYNPDTFEQFLTYIKNLCTTYSTSFSYPTVKEIYITDIITENIRSLAQDIFPNA